MPPPAFSRIALAAALIEYDNDSDDPNIVKRSAQDSAIFSHLRRSGPVPKPQSVLEYDDLPEPRRTRNFLRIALPHDADVGILSPTEPHEPPPRRSRDTRRSLDVLREQGEEYFERHQNGEDDEEHSDAVSSIENVDLASWGLDSFIPEKSKGSKDKAKPRQRSGPARIRPASEHLDNLPNPHSPQEMDHESPMLNPIPERPSAARSHSLFGDAGMRKLFLDEQIAGNADPSTFPLSGRRRTIAMPDEFGEMISALPILPPPRPGSAVDMSVDPSTVPFPDSRPASALGSLNPEEENTFAVPLPPPDRVSRFDPKAAAQSRPLSGSSWISTEELRAARQRAPSNASLGSRVEMQDSAENRDPSIMTGLADAGNRNSQMPPDSFADMRRLSRLQLMRPKVLIMPSPLREVKNNPNPLVAELKHRGGFEDSTGDRPLPVNFRASAAPGVQPGPRPLSMVGGGPGGLNEMLLPNNPRMSLSTTQLMFRNNLLVGGQRDVSYQDIDNHLARATQEGEKIEVYEEDPYLIENEFLELQRPTGKLLGKSLMDTLEARKAEIRGKKRVFTGDNRPSMMERQTVTKNTLIDPESFNMPQIAIVDGEGRPIKQDGGDDLARRRTVRDRRASAPLLEFGVANAASGGPLTAGKRSGVKARGSVFGVDTLWEREVSKLEKLKQAEAEAEAEEEKRLDEEARKLNSKRKKGKEKRKSQFSPGRAADENQPPTTSTRESQAPALPDISRVSTSGRPRPRPTRDEISDDDEMTEFGASYERRRESTATLGVKGWFAGGSDEEDEASRRDPDSRALTPNPAVAPGVRNSISPSAPRLAPVADDDENEDEDEPLVNKMHQIRASVFTSRAPPPEDDSDEDAPLVTLKAKVQSNAESAHGSPAHNLSPKPSPSPTNGQNNGDGDDDDGEDNVPLGLRASTLFPLNPSVPPVHPQGDGSGAGAVGEEDEDEKPLGLRYSVAPLSAEQQQQRYSTMLQQQQQQMYMQQMARNSMASFSGMGAFGAMGMNPVAPFMAPQMTGGTLPMGMGMGMGMPLAMTMPVVVPTPVPPNPGDAAKISRVDNWRKGVESVVPKNG